MICGLLRILLDFLGFYRILKDSYGKYPGNIFEMLLVAQRVPNVSLNRNYLEIVSGFFGIPFRISDKFSHLDPVEDPPRHFQSFFQDCYELFKDF